MLGGGRARHDTATRPCERPDFLRDRAPGHMPHAHQNEAAATIGAAPPPPKHGGPLEHRSRRSRVDKSAPRDREGVGNTAQGGHGPQGTRAPTTIPRRPSERPPLRPSMAAGWSVGAARSARKTRRFQTLQDGTVMGVSQIVLISMGGGAAGARRPIYSVCMMHSEDRGLTGAKGHLIMMIFVGSQARRGPRGSLVCAHGTGVRVVEQRRG